MTPTPAREGMPELPVPKFWWKPPTDTPLFYYNDSDVMRANGFTTLFTAAQVQAYAVAYAAGLSQPAQGGGEAAPTTGVIVVPNEPSHHAAILRNWPTATPPAQQPGEVGEAKYVTPAMLSDAFGCFWNAAMNAALDRKDSTATATVRAMVEGFAAVAARLKEHAALAPKEKVNG